MPRYITSQRKSKYDYREDHKSHNHAKENYNNSREPIELHKVSVQSSRNNDIIIWR